ncbi:MAG TPA: hypothetical protein IAB83_09205 [Candidatus Faecousia faecavium]|nr:hypothetical protein [Candidatus Faecousia faecavium]
MLIAPPFGLLAPGAAGSKDLSAPLADQFILSEYMPIVKYFFRNFPVFSRMIFKGRHRLPDTFFDKKWLLFSAGSAIIPAHAGFVYR